MRNDPPDLEARAMQILPGLLASGHYTFSQEERDSDDDSSICYTRYPDNWKEYARCRCIPWAVLDAIELARELHAQCEWERAEDAKTEQELAAFEQEKATVT